jgi:hypothetical protein
MKWRTILLADLTLSIGAGACFWLFALSDAASLATLLAEPAAVLSNLLSLRLR